MDATVLLTQCSQLRRVRTVDATDNGYPLKPATGTPPAASQGTNAAQATSPAVVDLTPGQGDQDGAVQNAIEVFPFGTGTDNATFIFKVLGWELVREGSTETDLWVPKVLGDFSCTLSTFVGVAGTLVGSSERFADTITLTGTSAASGDVSITSPADNTPARVRIDLQGCRKVEVIFSTGGSATGCNALVKMY